MYKTEKLLQSNIIIIIERKAHVYFCYILLMKMFTAHSLTVTVEGFAFARIEVWYETDRPLAYEGRCFSIRLLDGGLNCACYDMQNTTLY